MQHADSPHLDFHEDAFPAELSGTTSSTTSPSTTVMDLPPTVQDRDRWNARLHHFHRAAGHCSSRNLARIVKEANLEPWKVKMALDFKCPTCESLRPGGISSGNIPPAATHAQFGPWEAIGIDVSEWTIPGQNAKLKFLLMIDMATRLRVVYPLMEPFPVTTIKHETAELIIKALSHGWLAVYPKPRIIVADNAKTFASRELSGILSGSRYWASLSRRERALGTWIGGKIRERSSIQRPASIQNFKVIQQFQSSWQLRHWILPNMFQDILHTKWAFGRDYTISEEDYRTFSQLSDRATFANLTASRLRAEQIANKTPSQRILVRLGNSLVFVNHFETLRWLIWWWCGDKFYQHMFIKDLVVGLKELPNLHGLDQAESF